MPSARGLVILDRDGVINQDSSDYIRSAAAWVPLPGSIEAIARLSRAGFLIGVATNQSGVGRGYFTRETVYAMHRKLRRLVRAAGGTVDVIEFCPDAPWHASDCRKPAPGLLHRIARKTGIALSDADMVGDSLRDLEAGAAVGCRLWLVGTGNGASTAAKLARDSRPWTNAVRRAADLAAVATQLLEPSP